MVASETGLLSALVGLAGVIISNIDRIYPVAQELLGFRGKAAEAINGDWTGLFREYRSASKMEEISEETVTLKLRRDKITGTLIATRAHRRSRQVEGGFRYDFLVFSYFAAEPGRLGGVGATAFVLKGKAESGLLKGCWLGFDPEKDSIVAAPYVLTKDTNVERAKKENGAWLDQPCYYAPLSGIPLAL